MKIISEFPQSAFLAASMAAVAAGLLAGCATNDGGTVTTNAIPAAITLTSGWQLQDIAKVPEAGETVSSGAFAPRDWYRATVPGTVLTSLVNDGVYPEPLYGENNRPDKIPESLCRTSYWYRTQVTVPRDYAGRRVWLNFDGINYLAQVWVNGQRVGDIGGAFARGIFDVTALAPAGTTATVAVLIEPPPHPADPIEQTVALGLGPNGGILSKDGPTFICTQGWDWIPGIRDRDMGIWQKVTLAATGPVVLRDPYVVTHVPLPRTDSADIRIEATLKNVTDTPQTGVLNGRLGETAFQSAPVTLAPGETQVVKLTSATTPQLHLQNPRLWWPNGYGEPNLYPLHLSFDINGAPSDARDLNIGIREVTYALPSNGDNLTLSVNGVPVFAKGGDWGMDEAMKREPRERLEAQIRFHKEANYTIIRNWVGQSTSEDFYDLCDRNGIMLWDEFFQPNPSDSGRTSRNDGSEDILNIPLYLANVREKVLRYRNHPSIVLWCGRNEGDPSPPALADGLKATLQDLNPDRLYHANSNDGAGVRSGGPYAWRPPAAFYSGSRNGSPLEPFKTEIGSVSIPTLEAIYAMMPKVDAENLSCDDWAEHDLAKGADNGDRYVSQLGARYGAVRSLPDFVRKAQLADYEAFRAMYEGREAKLFAPASAVITWMSNPAQPSTTWQIYSYDLEPFASFFAVKKACEPVHVQMNQNNFHVMVINNRPQPLEGLQARVRVFNLDGTLKYDQTTPVTAPASAATDAGAIDFPADLTAAHFVGVELRDAQGRLLSNNFYWRGLRANDLTTLDTMPTVPLDAKIARHDADGKCLLDVTLSNPTKNLALMAHIQLRKQRTGARVLPVYYTDNYISLPPGESRTITVEAAARDLGGEQPLVVLDGWNVTTASQSFDGASIAPNTEALVAQAAPAN